MLRALSVIAPVVAAIMVVVLVVEPPALRPAERIPALRVLTMRSGPGLSPAQIQDAIDRGTAGNLPVYPLAAVPPRGQVAPDEPAGVLYPPWLRIAWAARARQQAGQPTKIEDVPDWMGAPVVYAVMRVPRHAGSGPAPTLVPTDTFLCCFGRRSRPIPPLWATDDPAVLARFGAPLPFTDLGVIAAYPIAMLQPGLEVVAQYRSSDPRASSRFERRGRIAPTPLGPQP